MKMKIYFLLFFLIISLANSEQFYRKILHTADPDAKCLDGSPGFMYFREGT